MPLLGQASGNWTESSSALRILHVGVRNTLGALTDDAFTQTNPPIVTTAATVSDQVDTSVLGVLSGSVAFTRPDAGANFVGGPIESLGATQEQFVKPLGLFINSAAGNAFENQPAAASGKGPFVSAMGTYSNKLFETQALATSGAVTLGDALIYAVGMPLMASRNGYLMPQSGLNTAGAAVFDFGIAAFSAEAANSASVTTIGILRMPSDSEQDEIMFDQRI